MPDKNIVIFGAGKIGRSFIGQLFGKAGYEVVFVETDSSLVEQLNRRKQYPVIIKGHDFQDRLVVENVRAVHALNRPEVIEAISHAGVMAVSVGKNALPDIAESISLGLLEREKKYPDRKLDIILAENMRSADLYLREQIRERIPSTFPLDKQVGLVETSIGKMVPIMTAADQEEDPLQVFAEPYSTLILDRNGFRGEIPHIPEFALKDNMKAWVDRKAFIHNLGHATAAYCGFLKHPEASLMYEVLADTEVLEFTRRVMQESATILMASYPGEFSEKSLTDHIDDLLDRFQNRNLGDTVFRVGSDLQRKLGGDDRFMGIIRLAGEVNLPHNMIIEAMSMGFHFRGKDERGSLLAADEKFLSKWKEDPDSIFERTCGLHKLRDAKLIRKLKDHYQKTNLE